MNETPLTEELALALLRSWQPNSDLERLKLGDMQAPYEVGAVLRMLRAGHPGDEIRKFLNVRATKLMKILNDEMTREQHAHARGQVIYDSPIKAV